MSTRTKEDVIKNFLKNDERENALDFIAFLNANEITPQLNDGNVFWYKNKAVCTIYVKGADDIAAPWMIWFSDEKGDKIGLNDKPIDERLKEFAWSHINTCAFFTSNGASCGCDNQPGRSATIFGKTFDNICHSTLTFINPNAESLIYIKKLAELMKLGILKNS
jgi:hypothetical protein